jgi:charged multivesicular body protein 5
VDEAELDAELEALGEEVAMDQELGEGMPSYLMEESGVPSFIDEPPETSGKVKEAAG